MAVIRMDGLQERLAGIAGKTVFIQSEEAVNLIGPLPFVGLDVPRPVSKMGDTSGPP